MWVAEARTVTSGRATIYYEVYGTGPAIVLIPGYFENHLCYFKNVPALVAAGYTVITTNLRGHFQSPCPQGELAFKHHPSDILAVLDAEGIERAALVGWSMGGFGALRLAVEKSDRVASLILMGSTAGVWSEENYRANGIAIETATSWIASGGPWPFEWTDVSDGVTNRFLRRQLQMLASDDGFLPAPAVMLPMMMDRSIWLELEELQAFQTPTLLVGGDKDTFLPARFQRHLVTLIPNARLSSFQDGGHNPHWDDPERFHADLTGFFRDTGW